MLFVLLAAEGQKTVDICWRVKNVYGEACLPNTTIVEWSSKFRGGRDSTQNTSQSQRPSTSNTYNKKGVVGDVIRVEHYTSIGALLKDFDISFGNVQHIFR